MSEGAFGLPLWLDFTFMVLITLFTLVVAVLSVAGTTAAMYTATALFAGILLGSGYESKKTD